MRSHLLVMSCILVLATLLVAVSLSGVIPEQIMRGQARNCGVVGFISFVGLCLVAGARQGIASAIPSALGPSPRIYDPAYSAARQALYEKLREIGLPSER
jgi:hypothetical protein